MRTITPRSRRRTRLPVLAAGTLLILLVGGGILAGMWATGVLEMPWAYRGQRVPEGTIPVPMSSRVIPRYTMVEREHLMDLRTGEWTVQFLPPNQVPDGVLTHISQVRGRVTAAEKPAGFFFVEADFLPRGTRPGISAGVPEGKRALSLEASRLRGVRSLEAGDRIDLLASIPLELLPYFGGMDSGWRAENVLSAAASGRERRTETRMLAGDAVVVEPVTTREIPTASGSLTEGTVTRMVPVQEIVIAVDRADVALVSEAVDQQLSITAIAHSGRPAGDVAETLEEGQVLVPVAARSVPAYSRLVREDLVDVRTRFETTIPMHRDEVERLGIVASIPEALGRVVARDILPGEFFSEDQLLAPGANPGVTAGIPPGKRAFTLDAQGIRGAHALGLGDRFDLLVSIPLDWSQTRPFGASMRLDTASLLSAVGNLQKQAVVRVVVHNGTVISPVVATKVNLPARLSQSREAMQQLAESAEQMIVAVAPDEAGRLAEAVALGLELAVVPRGNHDIPADQQPLQELVSEDSFGGWNPLEGMKTIEAMVGGNRQVFLLPGNGPGRPVQVTAPSEDHPDGGEPLPPGQSAPRGGVQYASPASDS